MVSIYNGTPHTLRIFSEKDTFSEGRKLFVNEGAEPIVEVPSDGVLNATKEHAELPAQFQGVNNIPLKGGVKFTAVDPLPEGYDVYVTSNLYRSARVELGLDTSQVATITEAVYDNPDNPRPCGCLALAVG